MNNILTISNFGVAFNDKVILSSIDLAIPEKGLFVLMGPAGTGKSTLLRTIAGLNDAHQNLRTWGEVLYEGRDINAGDRPALVVQNYRLLMSNIRENIIHDLPERNTLTVVQQKDLVIRILEAAGLGELVDKMEDNVLNLPIAQQRHLAIARTLAQGHRLVFIDEPTANLNEGESKKLLAYIRSQAEQRAILVVLHNQREASFLNGYTALMAGGKIQECRQTSEFFSEPQNEMAKTFIRTGSCDSPPPEVQNVTIPKAISPGKKLQHKKHVSDAFGPRGFVWLRKGEIAGTPQPGIVADVDYDLNALRRVGISLLISLTEDPFNPAKLAEYGIQNIHFPIVDMKAPNAETTMTLCQRIERWIENGEIIAVHCKAGLGRTGTILASVLIWEGYPAIQALETIRKIEPRWVQSQEQVKFLEEFGKLLSGKTDIAKDVSNHQ